MRSMLAIIMINWLPYGLQAQTLDWAQQAGGRWGDEGQAITTDAAGNCYVTGSFRDTAYVGSAMLISPPPLFGDVPAANVFIAKIDVEGNFLWATQAHAPKGTSGQGITTDVSGNSYVIGYFAGTADFGSTTLTSAGEFDIFISKLSASGEFLWTNRVGGTVSDIGESIATDAAGNCYVTGYFRGTATFGSTTLTATGRADSFFAKLDANGNFLWAERVGGVANQQSSGYGITADAAGNSYVTGYYQGTVPFGGTTLPSTGTTDTYIAKLDTDGNFLWALRAGGGTAYDKGSGVALDAAGNCYVAGRFAGEADFGDIIHTADVTADAFIAKLDAAGNFLWVQRGDGAGYNTAESISTDAVGNCFITGWFMATVQIGGTTLLASGGADIFIAQLDTDGDFLWAQQTGSSVEYDEAGYGIATDTEGNCFVTGYFWDIADIGGETLTSVGTADIFIAKLSPAPTSMPDAPGGSGATVFPNPATSVLNVRADGRVRTVDIHNASGALVRTEARAMFSVEQLPAGLYLLRIRTDKGVSTLRLVKE